MGTLNILETMRMIGIKKIVFASTYLIYEGYTGEVDEHTKPDIDAITLYSKSKLASEWLIKKYAEKYGIEYVMLRFGSIYGEEDRCSNLLNDFMDSAVNGVSIDVWGDGTAKKPLTDVSDIATGIVACLNETNEIFNVASNEHPSVNDLVEILKELNPEFIVNYDKTKSARAYPIVVTEKIRERTGWTQKTKFRDNVARIYESMKNK
jgi:nucleoside-diphosphate-sugar epimerase